MLVRNVQIIQWRRFEKGDVVVLQIVLFCSIFVISNLLCVGRIMWF